MHPRSAQSRVRALAAPVATLAFASLDSVALIGAGLGLALFGLWR